MAAKLTYLEPVSSRRTVGDMVYLKLRDALTVGRFDPDQVLTIGAMSEAFQTSHMPVREAMRRLTAEGALSVAASGSVRVPAVNRAHLDDIIEARVMLERRATERAVAAITDDGLRTIRQQAQAHAAADQSDIHEMLLRNRDFHFAIYRASGSDVLPALIESLWLRYGPYMRLLSDRAAPAGGGHNQYTRGHLTIVEAIGRGDASAAAQGIEADIRGTQDQLRRVLDDLTDV
ncbi:GntR family transcriptional regulator [Paracoccus sp. (in: a-proteobacteria)]|uniref:GntR family transcriptional regulator n=1 Tax=Paracoccus sp. TaxID=267 RepID=UPI003A89453D